MTTGDGGGPPREGPAVRALRLVTADPARAQGLARQARRAARGHRDAAELATAERTLGLVAREARDTVTALRHLRTAVRVAEADGLAQTAAEARMSLALVLAEAGRPGQALREIDAAASVLTGLPGARLQMQRALILDRLGRFDEAMAGYTRAIPVLAESGDRLWQARALTNRGVLHTYRGALRQAEADLYAAEALHRELGQDLAVAQVRHNLGFLAARAGDVPAALRWYDLADEYFARVGRPVEALMDRAELLRDARLLPEARATAEAALAAARRGRARLFEAQARLVLADTALEAGDLETARVQAAAARRAFVRQGRAAWAALARYTWLRAQPAARSPARLRAVRRVAGDLERAGWVAPALDARLYLATLVGDEARAARELRRVRAAGRRGPAALRARAWYAEALLRERVGRPAAAQRALRAGMRVVDEYRASLGATELRALASGYAEDLATAGLRLAIRAGRARSVLWWAERWKAVSLRLGRVPVPLPEVAADALAQLREVVAALDRAVGESRPRAALLRRQRVLEDLVRRQSWHTPGAARDLGDPVGADLPAVLGTRTLVEMIPVGGDIHAVVVAHGRYRMGRLCTVAEAEAALRALRFALRRIVLGHGTAASRSAAVLAARHNADRLDRLLFDPVRPWLGGGDLVLVPTGGLYATPWSVLATCRGRPVTVAPSASQLADAPVPGPAGGPAEVPGTPRPVLVAGPGLAHAEPEVRHLAGQLSGARLFTAAGSTVDGVLAALDGAALAHLAAHGEFRTDNPMFSHIRLADGPLTLYDLERLTRPPRLVVLSACESALSAVHPGDELLGLSSALLRLGTRTVLGSVLPADDARVRELMVAVYRRWTAGATPEAALAASQVSEGDRLDERTAGTAAFVCFGRPGTTA